MAKVAQLWNPRSNHGLRRYWISFEDQIVIGGENLDQAGVLSLRPAGTGELRARLRVMDDEFEQAVSSGNDIAVWINGLQLFVGVKAIDDERMLLAFGIPPGTRVNLTLESSAGVDEPAKTFPGTNHAAVRAAAEGHIGLCQTRV